MQSERSEDLVTRECSPAGGTFGEWLTKLSTPKGLHCLAQREWHISSSVIYGYRDRRPSGVACPPPTISLYKS